MVARTDMRPHARAVQVRRGHRFAAYPRCSADQSRGAKPNGRLETVVDPVVDANDAPVLAESVVVELVALGLVKPERTDSTLGETGYPPAGASVALVGVVGSPGDRAGANRAGLSRPERPPRTDAQDVEGGDGTATGGKPLGTAGTVQPLPERVQRGASARGAGPGERSSTRDTSRRATSARTAGFAGRSPG